MRLIDADALIDDCKKYLNTLNPDRDGKECSRIGWLIRCLNDAPTAEPEQPEVMSDGTLHITVDLDISTINRILLSQKGTHYVDLYYVDDDEPERKTGKWQKLYGYATPGGDPVWCCSECGKGIHVWGIEGRTYGGDIADHQWLSCPNCDARMIGEEE